MNPNTPRSNKLAHRLMHLVAACLFGGACAPVAAVDIGPGFTGAWYDPEQSGHGLFLEVLPNNQLLAFWFTFTPDGTQQSWFGGVGPYAGNKATLPVNLTTGGRWIPNFDPSKRIDHPWGTLTFTFSDCDHGRVDFTSSYPGYGSNHMDLTRLTLPAGLTCTSSASASGAKGLWTGTTSVGESAIVVVLDDGSYEIVYSKAGGGADAGVQFQLEFQPLWSAFLDEVDVAHAVFHCGYEAQPRLRCTRRQALLDQGGPGIGDALAQGSFGAGRRVPGDDVQTMGEGAGNPATADDSAAQGGKGVDVGDVRHGLFLEKCVG